MYLLKWVAVSVCTHLTATPVSDLSGQILDYALSRALLQLSRARFCLAGPVFCKRVVGAICVYCFRGPQWNYPVSLHQAFDISVYLIIQCFVKPFPSSSFRIGTLLIMCLILCLCALRILTPILSTSVVPWWDGGKLSYIVPFIFSVAVVFVGLYFSKQGMKRTCQRHDLACFPTVSCGVVVMSLLNLAKMKRKFFGFSPPPMEPSDSYCCFPEVSSVRYTFLLVCSFGKSQAVVYLFKLYCYVLFWISSQYWFVSVKHIPDSNLPGCCLCVMIHHGVLKLVTLPLFSSRPRWIFLPLLPSHL